MMPAMLLPPRITTASVQPTGPVTPHSHTQPINIFICEMLLKAVNEWMLYYYKKITLDILKMAKLNNLLQIKICLSGSVFAVIYCFDLKSLWGKNVLSSLPLSHHPNS